MATGDPNSITFSGETGAGGQLNASPATPNFGVNGAGVRQAQPVASAASWFSGTGGLDQAPQTNLPGFLDELAAPGLAKVKQEQMWQGFVAARSGLTQKDIDDSSPWYTKVFGPTNYEVGAMSYNTMTNAAKAETDIMQRMPELRKLNPQDFASELNKTQQSLLTGNGYADALLTKNFMDRSGPMTDVYTKERVAWQQTDLLNKRVELSMTAGQAYDQMAKSQAILGDKAPMDASVVDSQKQQLQTLVDALTPSRYQTDASVKAVMTTTFKSLASNDNWYTISALKKLGVLNHMDADDREGLEQFLDKAETRTRHNFEGDPQIQEMMARTAFTAAAGIGGKPTMDMMSQVNNRFRAMTGIDADYYTPEKSTGLISQSVTSHLHAQDQADNKQFSIWSMQYKASMKEDADSIKRNQSISAGTTAWNSANLGATLALPGVDKPLVLEGAYTQFSQAKAANPAQAWTQLVNNAVTGAGAVIPQVSDDLKNRALVSTSAPAYNDSFGSLYSDWKLMTSAKATHFNGKDGSQAQDNGESGKAAAMSYFGPDLANKMQAFDTMVQGHASADMAYDTVFGKNSLNYAAQVTGLDSGRTADLLSARADQIHDLGKRGTIMGWFHDDNMTDAAADQTARLLSQYMGSNGAVGGSESSMQVLAALKMAQAHGAEFTGRYALDNKGLAPVYQWKGFDTNQGSTTPQAAAHIINDAAAAAAKSVGLDPTNRNVNLIRMQNGPNGAPVIQVYGMTEDGWKFAQFSEKELKAAEAHQRVVQRQPTVPMGYVRTADGNIEQSLLQPKL